MTVTCLAQVRAQSLFESRQEAQELHQSLRGFARFRDHDQGRRRPVERVELSQRRGVDVVEEPDGVIAVPETPNQGLAAERRAADAEYHSTGETPGDVYPALGDGAHVIAKRQMQERGRLALSPGAQALAQRVEPGRQREDIAVGNADNRVDERGAIERDPGRSVHEHCPARPSNVLGN